MSEIPILNQQELLKIYTFGLKTKNNLIIFGNPGIGKSEIAEQRTLTKEVAQAQANANVNNFSEYKAKKKYENSS